MPEAVSRNTVTGTLAAPQGMQFGPQTRPSQPTAGQGALHQSDVTVEPLVSAALIRNVDV
jgi:hypothetical protein